MSGLDDPETKLVSEGKISHFVTVCIMTFAVIFQRVLQKKEVVSECRQKKELLT